MPDELIIIESLIQEHQAMSGHMKMVSALAEDWSGIVTGDDSTNLSHEQIQALEQKCLNLLHTMANLEEGLKRHWGHEDQALLDMLGNPLISSIKIEHQAILKQMNEINFILSKSPPQELLEMREYLRQIISHLCQLISDHENKENTVFELLKKQYI